MKRTTTGAAAPPDAGRRRFVLKAGALPLAAAALAAPARKARAATKTSPHIVCPRNSLFV